MRIFLAWTTTPWTLPSNIGLCVNPEEEYAKVKCCRRIYLLYGIRHFWILYLASSLKMASRHTRYWRLTKEKIWNTKNTSRYISVQQTAQQNRIRNAFFVTCDDYVTLTDGTGVVHIAPAFGEDDAKVGRKYDLPFVQLVDEKGNMGETTPFAGLFVKKADPEVLKDLDGRGLLFDAPKFEHSYPHCWRCDTPLIYYARESWFIKMTAVKDDLIANNNTINWIPESIGKGRFGDWLENVQDWGISRNRYWGTPLNIWECECGHQHSIGSIEELKSMSDNCPDNIELHRPYIDEVTIKCPKCGKPMHRVPEVIDCWFDSAVLCHLHSIIIHLRIKNCLSSSSRQILFPKQLTRPVDGSIPCLQFQH